MLALLGEKNVRLFPDKAGITGIVAPFSVDYDDFFENYSNNISAVILDLSCVDFSLDYMKGALIFEALESLRCKHKILKENERADIVRKEKLRLFSRSDFCIQNTVMNNPRLFQRIIQNPKIRDVFVIDQAICELCKSAASEAVDKIRDDTWWLYVAEHKSGGIKITAGRGNGIAYSRLFFDANETERKIKETLRFLAREGLDESVKIISFMHDISLDGLDLEVVNPVMPQSDIEITLVDIIKDKSKNLAPIFSKDNDCRRFLAEKNTLISGILAACIAACGLFLWNFYNASADLRNVIQIEKDKLNIFIKDASKTFFARVREDNFDSVKRFAEIASKMRNPLVLLQKVSKILKGRNIDEVQIDEEGSRARFKVVLDASELRELKELAKDPENGVELRLLSSEGDESGEDLQENPPEEHQKYGAEICVKMK